MQATKLIPIILIGGLLLASGVFYFVPSLRPAIVQKWFHQAKGFSNATSAEDALDKLRKAIEKRDYEAAKLYLTGDYLEQFSKGLEQAKLMTASIDNLRSTMKARNISSDKVDLWLYWLDPFPPFKYEVKNKSEGGTPAVIHWHDEDGRFKGVLGKSVDLKIDPNMAHALLPVMTAVPLPLKATVKEVEGSWKVEIPVSVARHVREGVQALEKHAGNYSNAIDSAKENLKIEATVKGDFEGALKSKLEKAN